MQLGNKVESAAGSVLWRRKKIAAGKLLASGIPAREVAQTLGISILTLYRKDRLPAPELRALHTPNSVQTPTLPSLQVTAVLSNYSISDSRCTKPERVSDDGYRAEAHGRCGNHRIQE